MFHHRRAVELELHRAIGQEFHRFRIGGNVPEKVKSYYEGYRDALCWVLDTSKKEYKLPWE